jgi:hypothetical protein
MKTLPFELDDGTLIYVEPADTDIGMERVGRNADPEARAVKRFTDAMQHIRPAAQAVLDTFREINRPAEVNLEFGVKFSAKLGAAILASADGEATFKVALKWTNPKPPEQG